MSHDAPYPPAHFLTDFEEADGDNNFDGGTHAPRRLRLGVCGKPRTAAVNSITKETEAICKNSPVTKPGRNNSERPIRPSCALIHPFGNN